MIWLSEVEGMEKSIEDLRLPPGRAAILTVTPQIMTGAAMSQLNAVEAF